MVVTVFPESSLSINWSDHLENVSTSAELDRIVYNSSVWKTDVEYPMPHRWVRLRPATSRQNDLDGSWGGLRDGSKALRSAM